MLFNFWEENNRLEHETAEEVRNTIKFVYRMWRQRKLAYSSWAFALPIPGAEFYDIAVKYGLISEDYYPSDEWNIYEHLRNVSKKEFNTVYAKARRQQAIMAMTSGHFEWRNWRGIKRKAMTMIRGKPNSPGPVYQQEQVRDSFLLKDSADSGALAVESSVEEVSQSRLGSRHLN